MTQQKQFTSAFDRTVRDLCEEIDNLTVERDYWMKMYETEREAVNQHLSDRLEESKRGLGLALSFALSVREGEDGSLVIPNDARKELANQYGN